MDTHFSHQQLLNLSSVVDILYIINAITAKYWFVE